MSTPSSPTDYLSPLSPLPNGKNSMPKDTHELDDIDKVKLKKKHSAFDSGMLTLYHTIPYLQLKDGMLLIILLEKEKMVFNYHFLFFHKVFHLYSSPVHNVCKGSF